MFYLNLKLRLVWLVGVVIFGKLVDFLVIIMIFGWRWYVVVLIFCRKWIVLRFLWLLWMLGFYLLFLCE